MFLLLQSMKHTCSSCGGDKLRVIKTYPSPDFTLRHIKCTDCGTSIYTHEYILQRSEYYWQRVNGKTRLKLKTE